MKKGVFFHLRLLTTEQMLMNLSGVSVFTIWSPIAFTSVDETFHYEGRRQVSDSHQVLLSEVQTWKWEHLGRTPTQALADGQYLWKLKGLK